MPVKHPPIRDDDYGVEDSPVVRAVKACQVMAEPGNAVALAAPGTVFNQILVPCPFLPGLIHQAADNIQLVVAGEYELLLPRFPPLVILQVNLFKKVPDQIQQAVPLPNFFPNIGGLESVRIGGISCSFAIALIEWKEPCSLSPQAGGHVSQVCINGKVCKASFEVSKALPIIIVDI